MNKWIEFLKNISKLYYDDEMREAVLSEDPVGNLRSVLRSDLPTPDVEKRVEADRIRDKLNEVAPNAQIWISDTSYGLVDKYDFRVFLEKNKIDLEDYEAVKHDCDDFSFRLLGATTEWCADLSIGIIWGDNHAFNVLVGPDLTVYGVEPQTDEVMELNQMIDKDKIWLIVM